MKTIHDRINKTRLLATTLTLAAFATLNAFLSTAHAQGSLTPPGAPAATMKTLAQIEPRAAITNSGAVTIAASGSYYLTTNITVSSGDAITIAADDVTLDLNGFTIASTRPTATTDTAILLSGGRTNVAIYNGHISSGVNHNAGGAFSGSGFGSGIFYSGPNTYNVRVKDVSILGVLHQGIYLSTDSSTVVESCAVSEAGNFGIRADTVSDSSAMNCGSLGIYCYSVQNSKGTGVGLTGGGINAVTANNCSGTCSGSGTGLNASGGIAIGCYGSSASGVAINAKIANSCYVGLGTTNITYKYNMP